MDTFAIAATDMVMPWQEARRVVVIVTPKYRPKAWHIPAAQNADFLHFMTPEISLLVLKILHNAADTKQGELFLHYVLIKDQSHKICNRLYANEYTYNEAEYKNLCKLQGYWLKLMLSKKPWQKLDLTPPIENAGASCKTKSSKKTVAVAHDKADMVAYTDLKMNIGTF